MKELMLEVTREADGGFCAECLPESIFTQGDAREDFRRSVQKAARAFFVDQPQNALRSRLRLLRAEILAGA